MARSLLLVFSSLGGRLVSFYCWAYAVSFTYRAGPSYALIHPSDAPMVKRRCCRR